MGVSKNRGTPKWMVYFMENLIKIDDLGGVPIIFGNIHIHKASMSWNICLLFTIFCQSGAPN